LKQGNPEKRGGAPPACGEAPRGAAQPEGGAPPRFEGLPLSSADAVSCGRAPSAAAPLSFYLHADERTLRRLADELEARAQDAPEDRQALLAVRNRILTQLPARGCSA
jgi:hypothetical protein